MSLQASRALVAVVVLILLSGAYWPIALDDSYITAAYAREWASSGEIRWPGGDRIEGYSNFAWMALMLIPARAGWDLMLFAKCVSLALGGLLIAFASWVLPTDRRGDVAVAALVLWTPVAYWSAMAMETMAFTCVLATGWVAVLVGSPTLGVALLAVLALLRPEGLVFFVVGLFLALRRHRRSALTLGLVCCLGLIAYHYWRFQYFGDLIPASVHLKVKPDWIGPIQLLLEIPALIGVLSAMMLLGSPSRWALPAVLFPAAVCCALLASLGQGDWMGVSRLILPGIATSTLAWGVSIQESSRWTSRWRWFLIPVLVCSALETPAYHLPKLRRVLPQWGQGLDTTLRGPVAYAMDHTPDGGLLWSADIGMLGNLPRMKTMDTRGLVSRDFLYRDAERLLELLEDEVQVIQSSSFRPTWWSEEPHAAGWDPPGLDQMLPDIPFTEEDSFAFSNGRIQAHFRFYRRTSADPPLAVRVARWQALTERYPAHPWIRWQRDLAKAAAGKPATAGPALSLPVGPLPGEWVDGRGFRIPAGSWRESGLNPAKTVVTTGPAEVRSVNCDDVTAVNGTVQLQTACEGPIQIHAQGEAIFAYLR